MLNGALTMTLRNIVSSSSARERKYAETGMSFR
jgi:hypothetical protein